VIITYAIVIDEVICYLRFKDAYFLPTQAKTGWDLPGTFRNFEKKAFLKKVGK